MGLETLVLAFQILAAPIGDGVFGTLGRTDSVGVHKSTISVNWCAWQSRAKRTIITWHSLCMLYEGFSFTETNLDYPDEGQAQKHVWLQKILKVFERRLGVTVIQPTQSFLLGEPKLHRHTVLANQFIKAGIISGVRRAANRPDEPAKKGWVGTLVPSGEMAGGIDVLDDGAAITKMLSEALERQIWFEATDYFKDSKFGTENELRKHGLVVSPASFASFSPEQRCTDPLLTITEQSVFQWIKGYSLLHEKAVYIPAQVISPKASPKKNSEPLIRQRNTSGLATWPDTEGARLSGLLEVIERDAFMILWLNQLSLPRVDLDQLNLATAPGLAKLLKDCKKYQLSVSLVPLLTDAPTHVVMAVVEDMLTHCPRFTVGLSAHGAFNRAAEHALLEALRARNVYRKYREQGNDWDTSTPIADIGHRERMYYWGVPENASALTFLVAGNKIPPPYGVPWESEDRILHYRRLIAWVKQHAYECVAVTMGSSRLNVTDLKVEMMVLPDLLAMHLHEVRPHLGGASRRIGIPTQFGYSALPVPFTTRPHPFC